jgi:hypothetical protein
MKASEVIALILINGLLALIAVHGIRLWITGRRLRDQPHQAMIAAPPDRLMRIAIEIVEDKHYVVDHSDSATLVFKTGFSRYSWRGQIMKVSITDNEDGTCGVHVTGRRNPAPQVFDWYEADRVAARFLQALSSRLSGQN